MDARQQNKLIDNTIADTHVHAGAAFHDSSVSVQLNVAYLEWPRQARLPRGSTLSSGGIYVYAYTYAYIVGYLNRSTPAPKELKVARLLNRQEYVPHLHKKVR